MLQLAQNECFNAFLKTTPPFSTIKHTSLREVWGNFQTRISKLLNFQKRNFVGR